MLRKTLRFYNTLLDCRKLQCLHIITFSKLLREVIHVFARFEPEKIFKAIQEYRITTFMGVPATFIHTWTATTAQEKEGRIDWSPNTYAAVIDPNTLEFLVLRPEYRDELPKSAAGKYLRRVLRDEEMRRKGLKSESLFFIRSICHKPVHVMRNVCSHILEKNESFKSIPWSSGMVIV